MDFKHFFLERFQTSFALFVIIYFALTELGEHLAHVTSLRVSVLAIHAILTVYFIFMMIYVARHSLSRLMHSESTGRLIVTYVIFLMSVILIFSSLFNVLELTRAGYITYGSCTDRVQPNATHSYDFFYFTAITFFTVGYGDICPMGAAKILSIIVAFAGNILSVIIVSLIINSYIRRRESRS